MKILVTGLTSNVGGIETFYMGYYRLLKNKGYNFDFVTVDKFMAFEHEIISNGDSVYKITSFKKNPIKYIKQLKKIILQNGYDVLHANMLSAANILPIWLAHKYNINKIIAHSHNAGIPSGKVRQILNSYNKKYILKYANEYMACSELAGKWFFGEKCRYVVLKNAIDINRYEFSSENRKKIRKKYNIRDEIVIGNIGKICEQKNQLFLARVFEKLQKNDVGCKLMLVGNGENEILTKYVEKLDIIKLPAQSNIEEYYSCFDIFVLPSLFEGLPVVGVEAQANGLPCLFSEKITKEVKFNENCEFLDLDIDLWVERINSLIKFNKIKRTNKIYLQKNGYDINSACCILDKIYNSKINISN